MGKSGYDYCLGSNSLSFRKKVSGMLNKAGFYNSGTSKSIPELLRTLRLVQPWLAIVDTALPPGNIEQLASVIENDSLSAAIYINTTGIDLDIYVQLPWPVEAPVLNAVAEAVCNEFAHKKKLHQEVEILQNKLNQRKIIEKAKGYVQDVCKLNEEEAYQFLRRSSMEKRISLAELAKYVIDDPGYIAFLSPHRQNP